MEDVKHVELNENHNYEKNDHEKEQVNDQNSKNIQNSNSESFTTPITKTSTSATSINQEPCSNENQCPHIHGYPYPAYAYPYPYPWCPSPPPNMMNNEQGRPTSWPYYAIPYPPTSPLSTTSNPIQFTDQPPAHINYAPYPFYYPYYAPPPPATPPPYMMRAVSPSPTGFQDAESQKAHDPFYPYPPPPAPYMSYPYPVPPAYTLSPSSSCASSVLPDIIITPSTDDVPSKVVMQHKVKVVKEKSAKNTHVDIEEVLSDSSIRNVKNDRSKDKNFEHVELEDVFSDTDTDDEKTPQGDNVAHTQTKNNLCTTKSVKNFKTFDNPIQKQTEEEYDSDATTIEEDEDFQVYENKQTYKEKQEMTKEVIVDDSEEEEEEEEVSEEEEDSEEECSEEEIEKKPISEQIKPIIIVTDDNIEGSEILTNAKKETDNPTENSQINDKNYDVFASLRAMKLQAQKLREKSVEYWGAPTEKKEQKAQEPGEIAEENQLNNESEIKKPISLDEAKNNFWTTLAALGHHSGNSSTQEDHSTTPKLENDYVKTHAKNEVNFLDKREYEEEEYEYEEIEEEIEEDEEFEEEAEAEIEEVEEEEDEAELKEIVDTEHAESSKHIESTYGNIEAQKNLNEEPVKTEEEEVDFWAIIEGSKDEDDWTLKKKDVKISSFEENFDLPSQNNYKNYLEEKVEKEVASELVEEHIEEEDSDEDNENTEETEEEFDEEEEKHGDEKFEEEEIKHIEQNSKDEDEVDFWAEIEKSRSSPTNNIMQKCYEPSVDVKTIKYDNLPQEQYTKAPDFDPTKYPEEPREVDTDEEIDFWAEIEENRRNSDEFLGFRQAANFWASRDAANEDSTVMPIVLSQKETEITNEAESFDIEQFKGEDPIFINENTLEDIKEEADTDLSSAKPEMLHNNSEEKHEVDTKRSNYRKAMAVFSAPIDEQKEKVEEKHRENVQCQSEKEISPIKSRNSTFEEVKETKAEDTNPTKKISKDGLPDLGVKSNEEIKISVRDRVNAFESVGSIDKPDNNKSDKYKLGTTLSVESYTPKSNLSRNSSQRSESGGEEEDSGVTDMNRQLSETDTDVESFPELRKMSTYQRASTHSRLFKLLQEETNSNNEQIDEQKLNPSRRKIVHNVSVTRRQNPSLLKEAESMAERRERLSLPLTKNISIDADNPSTPNSPASPLGGESGKEISDALVKELVESLLLRSDSTQFRDLPMEKLQAAAKRALEEELDSLENTSVETTPNTQKAERSYTDYYDSWSDATSGQGILPSKTFRTLQDRASGRRSPWTARCPRVLSSKTINSDLARVTESPEIMSRNSPLSFKRETSINRHRKY